MRAGTLKGGASVEEETSRRMAKEREERVARVQHTALKKLMQQQLGKGFYSWQQEVLEQNRRLRLLRQAGGRLGKPKLASGFMFWASEARRLRYEAGAKTAEKGHQAALRQLRATLQTSADVGYVPVQELVATHALDRLVLATDHTPEAGVARRHWKEVKMLLMALSGATADCIDTYTRSEFERIGQTPVDVEAWRRVV